MGGVVGGPSGVRARCHGSWRIEEGTTRGRERIGSDCAGAFQQQFLVQLPVAVGSAMPVAWCQNQDEG